MPDQPRELSAGVRRLLEQHERNGGRTILGPDMAGLGKPLLHGLLLAAFVTLPLMWARDTVTILISVICYAVSAGLAVLALSRMIRPFQHIVDEEGIRIDSRSGSVIRIFQRIVDGEKIPLRPEERPRIPWSEIDAVELHTLDLRYASRGWITLHVRCGPPVPSDAVPGGEQDREEAAGYAERAALPQERRAAARPTRAVPLPLHDSYSARRAEETAQFLMRLREQLHGRSLEEG